MRREKYLWVIYLIRAQCAALNRPANLENSAVATGPEKASFHSSAKELSNCHTIALISHASKIMLKILQARLQQYMNRELPTYKMDLDKAEEPEIKLPTSAGSQRKQGNSRKHLFLLHDHAKAFDCVDHNKLWKILKRDGNPKPPDLSLEKSVCRSRSNS